MHELDLADALVRAPADRAFCLYQRAGLLTRLGRNEEAERCYLEAIPALRTAGYRVYEANSLTNVGIARTFRGDCRHGREDFLAAHRIFVSLRLPGAVAVSEHNLGFVASRAGDLNTAFEHFERARRRHVRSKLPLGPLIVDHCEALLAAGLAEEAYARLCDLLPELEDASQEVDRADALLLAATAALRANRPAEAEQRAIAARTEFEAQDRLGWPDIAALLALEARLRRTDGANLLSSSDVAEADELAQRLRSSGQHLPALHARLLGAELDSRVTGPEEGLRRARPCLAISSGRRPR